MDPGLLLSFRRFGYRMIGDTAEDRFAGQRARYLGDAAPLLNLGPQNLAPAGGSFAGETYTPGPTVTPHVLQLHLGPPPAAAPPTQHPLVLHLHLSPQTSSAPPPLPPPPAPTTDAAAAPPTIVATPACPTCTSPVLAAGAGAAGGALLMYFVGLATREMKKKRGRRR